jgi:hypothetical protein
VAWCKWNWKWRLSEYKAGTWNPAPWPSVQADCLLLCLGLLCLVNVIDKVLACSCQQHQFIFFFTCSFKISYDHFSSGIRPRYFLSLRIIGKIM